MEARRCGRIPALSRTASCAASPRRAAQVPDKEFVLVVIQGAQVDEDA
jgi:hypothetical protein